MATMGSGIDSSSGLDSTSSLELALDQAIARRWAGAQERPGRKRRPSPYPAALGHTYTPTPKLRPATSTALTVPSRDTALAVVPTRLRWRGIEVSEEFQEYAARVARGEQLAPYRGAVLSRPCAEFPWTAAPTALLPAAPLPRLPSAPLPAYPERGRGLKTALWLTGALASIVGALGVGVGATSVESPGLDASIESAALALKPAPALPAEEPLSSLMSSDDLELPPPSPVVGPPPLVAPGDGAPRVKATAKPSPRRVAASARPLAASAARPPEAQASAASGVSAAPRLTIPPPTSVPPLDFAPAATPATSAATRAPGEDSSGHGSSLFSDRAPF